MHHTRLLKRIKVSFSLDWQVMVKFIFLVAITYENEYTTHIIDDH